MRRILGVEFGLKKRTDDEHVAFVRKRLKDSKRIAAAHAVSAAIRVGLVFAVICFCYSHPFGTSYAPFLGLQFYFGMAVGMSLGLLIIEAAHQIVAAVLTKSGNRDHQLIVKYYDLALSLGHKPEPEAAPSQVEELPGWAR